MVPGLASLSTGWSKLQFLSPPDPLSLTVTGAGALIVNLLCAFLLAPYRSHGGSLTKAAFLSARNGAIANIGVILAGLITAFLWSSAWPNLIVGIGIAAMNADATRQVFKAAKKEHRFTVGA